jgi:hypothetical protein
MQRLACQPSGEQVPVAAEQGGVMAAASEEPEGEAPLAGQASLSA